MARASSVVDRLGRAAPEHLDPESVHALARTVSTAVPNDGWCLLGLDPVGLHRTFQFSRGGSVGMRQLARLEAGAPDVNRYADLAASGVPAGWLSSAHPEARTSSRLNEHLRPQGITAELRLLLRDRGRVWGALALFRRGGRDFDDHDVRVLTACAPVLTATVRRDAARRSPAQTVPGDGLVLLDAEDAIVSQSAAASAWLADLVPGGDDSVDLDDVTRVLYDTAQAARADRCAIFTRRTASGRWLTVAASRVDGNGGVGVSLRAATARERLSILARAAGLTVRETEVVDKVVLGHPTKQIATALGIGVWTTEDHLASIYRKLSVRGRDELFALLIDL